MSLGAARAGRPPPRHMPNSFALLLPFFHPGDPEREEAVPPQARYSGDILNPYAKVRPLSSVVFLLILPP